ncbi:helix-turn-helix domain-containing protein [Jeotgalibaca caeni]|uniref:helix-turn-helix domain-containing protein n=1 Tax=Jeotgalibaca caeni TaxID=3028623 RepID=UPI00237E15FB|nr:AraC family transcriptional regulator [Jeotgalibaca caeni]MDE1548642.1 AraC family transcriptional regulator [Jeotgalibaca caeni]
MKALSLSKEKEGKSKLQFLKKHGTSFNRIFLFLALIGILFSILSLTSIYTSTRDSVTNNVQDTRLMTTNQIKNTFEREIQTIEKSFNTYSTTNDFYEVVQEPFGISDFQKYREINSLLNYFSTFSLSGTSYSIVSVAQNWRFDNGSLQQMTEDEMKEFEDFYINNRNENLYWVKGNNSIVSVNLLPFFSRDKLAVGLANIPNRSIHSLLEVTSATTPFFIVNRNDEVLYSANLDKEEAGPIPETIAEIRAISADRPVGVLDEFTGMDQGFSLIYAKSDYNNWLYITYLDHSEIQEALSGTKYGLLLLAVVLIIASITIAYLVAGRVTRPIETLKKSLAVASDGEGTSTDDWDFISQRIDTIVTKNKTLENLYQREEPELKKQFMQNLYRNRLLPLELEQRLTQFRYPAKHATNFAVMLIQMDDSGSREIQNKDIFLVGINEMVKEIIPLEHRLTPIVLNDQIQVTLLAFPTDDVFENKRLAIDYANQMMEALQMYMNLSVSIAFSPFFTDLLAAKENLDFGKETLAYHLILDHQAIIFYEDIEQTLSTSEISEYPEGVEAELFQAIRLGEVEKVETIASELLDTIISSSNLPINVQVALLRLALNLVQLSQTLNSQVLSQERGNDLYEATLQAKDFNRLKYQFLQEIILPFAQEMSEKNAQQFHRLSEQIIQIIEADFMEDINLETIGSELHYNPNYLSNIFKKETGVTFSDYLTSYRFTIAKEWLRDTEVTIKEISERLQYRNPQNFIRSFKKKESMTPGEYRKMHRAE